MCDIQLLKLNGNIYECKKCKHNKFKMLMICSTSPFTLQKYQVLKVIVECRKCKRKNVYNHTKIKDIKMV